jgi:hypothetical protein
MFRARIIAVLFGCLWLVTIISLPVIAQDEPARSKTPIFVFDVMDLAVRIDEPKLKLDAERYVLNCAVANRTSEQLLGLRLVLLLMDESGKIRARASWSDSAELAPSSIKPFQFHTQIKEQMRATDRVYVIVEEVTGRETIWHVVDAEKVLRAYARGENNVIATVRKLANKFDPRPDPPIIRREKR